MPCEASGYSISLDWAMPSGGRLPDRKRHRNIRRAVQHQGRHLDSGEFGAEIGFGEGIDASRRRGDTRPASPSQASRSIISCVTALVAGRLASRNTSRSRPREIRLAIALHALLDAVEHGAVDPDRIVLRLQQIMRGRADKRRPSRRCGRYAARNSAPPLRRPSSSRRASRRARPSARSHRRDRRQKYRNRNRRLACPSGRTRGGHR